MRTRTILAGLAVTTVGLTSCGQAPWEDSMRDLEGVTVKDPGKVVLYNNVDLHPNIVMLCVNGVGFATTTRDLNAVLRVPEWDAECSDSQDTEQ